MKEKFVRTASKKNIGEIGVEPTPERNAFLKATIDFVMQNREQYRDEVLQKLINEYGEEEGKRQFEMMMLAADDSFKAIQNIDMDSEEEKSSGLRK